MKLNKSEWNRNKELYIWIFDVGRGMSAFVKTIHNYGVMVDCGTSEDFNPFSEVVHKHFLPCLDVPVRNGQKFRLAQLIVSHPHSDHCAEFDTVIRQGKPMFLTTPHSNPKEPDLQQHVNWNLVDNRPGTEGPVLALKDEINRRDPPLKAYIDEPGFSAPGFSMEIFFIPPRVNETTLPKGDYTNNLSIAVYMSLGGNSILFMGDLMPSGVEYLLGTDSNFARCVKAGISFVVVPHHGLESGFCSSLYRNMPKVKSHWLISSLRSERQARMKGVHTLYIRRQILRVVMKGGIHTPQRLMGT